jgi:catechol 2,3-dioxygenase-like lactoylglutathione lyase family enzyme
LIDHTSLGVRNYDRSVAFYTSCLQALGYDLQRLKPDEAAFGVPERWGFFLYPADAGKPVVGERNHVAFTANSREQVEAFHRAGLAGGGKQVRPPGERPDISPDYFGTVLTDPDGHTLEAVYWSKA